MGKTTKTGTQRLVGTSTRRKEDPRQPVLAGTNVRHVGEAVAAVVAEDPYRLADALEKVIVNCEPLPVASSPAVALSRDAPLVHDDWPDNVAGLSTGETGDVTPGFAIIFTLLRKTGRWPVEPARPPRHGRG